MQLDVLQPGQEMGATMIDPGAGADPHVGQIYSNCHVMRKLGQGGMGAVYKALDTRLGVPVAVPSDVPSARN